MKIYTYNGKNNVCGQRIRMARLAKNMTQERLATKMQLKGIPIEHDSISRIENGSRFVADYELKKLSEILDVTMDWLLQDIDE